VHIALIVPDVLGMPIAIVILIQEIIIDAVVIAAEKIAIINIINVLQIAVVW
jgi:hypothetical protein